MRQYCNTANLPTAPSQKGDYKAIDRHPNGNHMVSKRQWFARTIAYRPAELCIQRSHRLDCLRSQDRPETLPIVLFLGLNISLDVDHALCRDIFS
jgi:hypothetical protein